MSIAENLKKIKETLKTGVNLVAVSKYHPVQSLQEAYDCGQRIFGESHVQELVAKEAVLPKDIEWHFIGHLQTNKVKYIAPFVSLIHSVDSIRLMKEINKYAIKFDRVIDCLVQVHIAKEETKFGFAPEELSLLFESAEFKELQNIRICGLMCMATNTEDEELIRNEFKYAKKLFDNLKVKFFPEDNSFKELSMGMSDDYQIAQEEGSTLVRVGSKIFGHRIYK